MIASIVLRSVTSIVVAAALVAGGEARASRAIRGPGTGPSLPGDGSSPVRPIRPPFAGDDRPPAAAPTNGHPEFASPHADPIAVSGDGRFVYVANTPADTLDVIDTAARRVVRRIAVGVDPVGVALRPDGRELWVANHVSDSVSVIDTDAASPTFHHVVATVQAFDETGQVTAFDEPVGVTFASDRKAYVALSSVNRIAVVDVTSRQVVRQLEVTAQDPRAIRARDGRLYVVSFESGNQTVLSGCLTPIDGDRCTFGIQEHVIRFNNIRSVFYDADIVRDPRMPDRDLFVFDTETDALIETVSSIGTLLYGVTVDSRGRVFIAQTEARNDANGRAGTRGDTLAELDNRAFLNQIARVDCGGGCAAPRILELEPLPPLNPGKDRALATPWAIQVSDDDATLVATAASSSRLFTVDAESGAILGRTDVGGIPRGLALESDPASGRPERAWVYNAVENSVSLVDVSRPAAPRVVATVTLDDPTEPLVKQGRLAFHDANATTTGTFSCESCHSDGNTDQILWILGGPKCDAPGCTQIQPRSTMPIRGLRDTLPLHWDGVPGDPFGGTNGQIAGGPLASAPPRCSGELDCFRDLVDGSLSSTMCDLDDCGRNDAGLPGELDEDARDAMAVFLMSVPYPPAPSRPIDDDLSPLAREGFENFFHNSGRGGCGNPVSGCHALPLWAGTNSTSSGSGFDAPTFRGIQDRWLQTPNGRALLYDLLVLAPTLSEVPWRFETGHDELASWAMGFGTPTTPAINRINFGFGPFAVWQMFLEGGTGFSGAFARQVTIDARAAGASRPETEARLADLERAAADGVIELSGEGVRFDGGTAEPVTLVFARGVYAQRRGRATPLTRGALLEQAASGALLVTFTGRLGPNVGFENPQPLLWSEPQPGRAVLHRLPHLPAENPMELFGRHVAPGAFVLVDGRRVDGTVGCAGGGRLPRCDDERVEIRIDLDGTATPGMHLLQVVNVGGLTSNEFPIFLDE